MLKRLAITVTSLLCWSLVTAQPADFIDIGKIREYDTVLKRLLYFTDYSKKSTIADIAHAPFHHPGEKFPFDKTRLDARYFIKLPVTNSSQQDTFWLYPGRSQRYTMYAYDSSTATMQALNNQFHSFSYTVFNDVPYAFFIVKKGTYKVFYIQADIGFHNWHLFDPVILLPQEQTAFTFDHFLRPHRLYTFTTIALLGIMFSMLVYTFTIFLQTLKYEYLYYALAMLVFVVYFFLRLLNLFMFNELYYFFYDLRYQVLQLTGNIFVIAFISSFFSLRKTFPDLYKHFNILIFAQLIFLSVNLPLTYTNRYNYIGNIAFDTIRAAVLLYSAVLIALLITRKKNKEAKYLGIGSFIAILLACVALYTDGWSEYEHYFFGHAGIPVLVFTLGILLQMIFFMQVLSHRERMQREQHIRAVEQLQLENDRKELEKYRAVIDARDKERNRISQEIHDDIGSGLTSIRLLSEIAKAKSTHHNAVKELEKISGTANVLIDKMNEIIWTLNSRNDTLFNLIAYLRHLVVAYFEPLPIGLHIVTPENISETSVSGKIRRNILLAVKEALHNIVKHSQATEVHIHFTAERYFSISITDNGIGFNPSLTYNYNNGLKNIRERLSAIGGSCIISNNEGTSIILKVPLY
ncbi:MAG TPA: 7TM diverse intracellular signaling domain-containing protein [Agriterribacter sp.]|nr:7TM diverse intracellular signaling domain-containing protein [Agriterribacter sp.]